MKVCTLLAVLTGAAAVQPKAPDRGKFLAQPALLQEGHQSEQPSYIPPLAPLSQQFATGLMNNEAQAFVPPPESIMPMQVMPQQDPALGPTRLALAGQAAAVHVAEAPSTARAPASLPELPQLPQQLLQDQYMPTTMQDLPIAGNGLYSALVLQPGTATQAQIQAAQPKAPLPPPKQALMSVGQQVAGQQMGQMGAQQMGQMGQQSIYPPMPNPPPPPAVLPPPPASLAPVDMSPAHGEQLVKQNEQLMDQAQQMLEQNAQATQVEQLPKPPPAVSAIADQEQFVQQVVQQPEEVDNQWDTAQRYKTLGVHVSPGSAAAQGPAAQAAANGLTRFATAAWQQAPAQLQESASRIQDAQSAYQQQLAASQAQSQQFAAWAAQFQAAQNQFKQQDMQFQGADALTAVAPRTVGPPRTALLQTGSSMTSSAEVALLERERRLEAAERAEAAREASFAAASGAEQLREKQLAQREAAEQLREQQESQVQAQLSAMRLSLQQQAQAAALQEQRLASREAAVRQQEQKAADQSRLQAAQAAALSQEQRQVQQFQGQLVQQQRQIWKVLQAKHLVGAPPPEPSATSAPRKAPRLALMQASISDQVEHVPASAQSKEARNAPQAPAARPEATPPQSKVPASTPRQGLPVDVQLVQPPHPAPDARPRRALPPTVPRGAAAAPKQATLVQAAAVASSAASSSVRGGAVAASTRSAAAEDDEDSLEVAADNEDAAPGAIGGADTGSEDAHRQTVEKVDDSTGQNADNDDDVENVKGKR